MIELTPIFIVVAAAVAFLVGLSKGGLGGAAGALATPLMALVMPAEKVIGLVLPWRYNLAYFAAGGSVLPEVFFRDAFPDVGSRTWLSMQ